MAARGAFLAPALVPVSSCFVNLPRPSCRPSWAAPSSCVGVSSPQSSSSIPPIVSLTRGFYFIRYLQVGAGSTILELSWETVDGYVQRVCVGWIGGLVKDGALRRWAKNALMTMARVL